MHFTDLPREMHCWILSYFTNEDFSQLSYVNWDFARAIADLRTDCEVLDMTIWDPSDLTWGGYIYEYPPNRYHY